MFEESLLERIRRLETPSGQGRSQNVSDRLRSILQHLRRMLNTRQGGVPIAEDFGLPDITNFPSDDLVSTAQDLERVLMQVIQKYEPRLEKARIHFEPKPGDLLTLRFRLEANMVDPRDRGRTIPIVLETVVSPNGLIKVES